MKILLSQKTPPATKEERLQSLVLKEEETSMSTQKALSKKSKDNL